MADVVVISQKESILKTIKKLLLVPELDTSFDLDITIHINTAIMVLRSIGVGPVAGFSIMGEETKWTDFIADMSKLESVKTYIYLKVRLAFDPPTSGILVEAIKSQISELGWLLMVETSPTIPETLEEEVV